MSGRPPPPLPPSASAPALHEIDGAPGLGEVVGDADREPALPSSADADDGDDAGADLLLAVVDEAAQVLRVRPLDGREQLDELAAADLRDGRRRRALPSRSPPPSAICFLASASWRSSCFFSSTSALRRSTTSSGRVCRTRGRLLHALVGSAR